MPLFCKKLSFSRQSLVYLLFSCFVLFGQTIQANSFKFKIFNSTNGFPQSSIRAIAEDKTGFLWLGTEGGLIRYDGINTTVFRNDPADTTSLPENVIDSLLVDKRNRLWVGTVGNGLSLFDAKTNQFRSFDIKVTGDVIHTLSLASSGDILVGASNGVFSISPENLSIKSLAHSSQLKDAFNIAGLWEDKNKTLWIATLHGYLFYFDHLNKLSKLNKKDNKNGEGGKLKQLGGQYANKFTSLKYTQKHGLLVTAAKQGLYRIDTEKRKVSSLLEKTFPDNSVIYDIAESKDNTLWIASNLGLFQWKDKATRMLLVRSNPNDENSLSQNDLRTLFISHQELLWAGTKTKGLNALNLKTYGFENIAPFNPIMLPIGETSKIDEMNETAGKEPSPLSKLALTPNLDDSTIWSIFKDNSNGLWIGTNKGLDYKAQGEPSFKIINTLGTDGVSKGALNIYEAMALSEANGLLWIGTYDKGLIGYDVKNNIVRHHFWPHAKEQKNRLSGKIVRVLQVDIKRNCLWIGTKQNGLNKLDLNTYKITQFKHIVSDKKSLPHNSVRAIYLAPDNRLWVGTGNGLSVFNESTHDFNSLNYRSGISGLSDEDVRAFYQSDENTLWVATGNGLNKLSINPLKVISQFGEKQGLAESTLYSLLPDDSGDLWISTLNGLSRFNSKTLKFTNYYAYHGLQDNEFNFNAWYSDSNDVKEKQLYFGGINGVSYFKPSEIANSYIASNPIIVKINAFDKNLKKHHLKNIITQSIPDKSPILLDKSLRRLAIDFSSLEFIAPQRVNYRYRLKGLESEWNTANIHEQRALYTNLNQGHYTFELESLDTLDTFDNNTNNHDNPKLSIPFFIQPTLWETLWFKLVLGLLGLLVLLGMFLYRERVIRKQTIDGERLQHYRKVVHELKTPLIHVRSLLNRLDSGDTNIINLDKNNDATDVTKILQSSKTNIRRSLHFLDQLHSVVKLNSKHIENIQEFLLEDVVDESLLAFLDPNDNQHSRLQVSDYDKASVVRTFDGSLYLILNNLISNALKYSPLDSPIHLNIQVNGNDLLIECLDQGTSIPEAAEQALYQPHSRFDTSSGTEGLGLGLHIIKQVVDYHNGSIKIDHSNPLGNHFMIHLKGIVI